MKIRSKDHLGSIIPRGTVTGAALFPRLKAAMDAHRFRAGHGVPTIPTRYVVAMNPADRAWMDPTTEDHLAAILTDHAETVGLILGAIEVEFRSDKRRPIGQPSLWVGFAEDDLLVLASPSAAATVFETARTPA